MTARSEVRRPNYCATQAPTAAPNNTAFTGLRSTLHKTRLSWASQPGRPSVWLIVSQVRLYVQTTCVALDNTARLSINMSRGGRNVYDMLGLVGRQPTVRQIVDIGYSMVRRGGVNWVTHRVGIFTLVFIVHSDVTCFFFVSMSAFFDASNQRKSGMITDQQQCKQSGGRVGEPGTNWVQADFYIILQLFPCSLPF